MLGDFNIDLLLSYNYFTFRIYPRLGKCTRLSEALFNPVEQPLLKNMNIFGDLTHGRGVSDSGLAMWKQGMTALQHNCDGIEQLCGIDLNSSDQHLKISDSRVRRDNDDCMKMV
ncbi:hypothetical protein AVEN_114373-1 [Araneus ventricosus]|uniref:Uncharacterized protein n=1 Tax=Araneus ventricosus TaxID=182803 RepID=A0A4Y2THQ7_ARAVE|nr:hypothetical protein AVEN_237551-1 [Araneus ventricosus]GBN98939.1 hypothetical protein AVEN_114373-1 [Araneus ventricosus]